MRCNLISGHEKTTDPFKVSTGEDDLSPINYKKRGEKIMKNNKNSLLILPFLIGIVFLMCLPVFASPVEELQLTDQQVVSIKTIIRQANEKVMQAAEDSMNSRPLKFRRGMNEIQTIRNDTLREIRGLLNPNQQIVFDQWSAQWQRESEDKKEMMKSLNLTKQQRIKIAKISESSEEAAWRIAGNCLGLSEMNQQLVQVRANTMQMIRQQLKPEQQINFDSWLQENSVTKKSRSFNE